MNIVEIAGFLGADAEERFTPNGKRVISLRVGVKVRHNNKDETIWWRVSIWGDRFDKMVPYLKKGTGVIIIGEMGKPEVYNDKEGRPQISLNLTAEIIKFSPFGKPSSSREGGEQVESRVSTASRDEEMAFSGASFDGGSGFTNDDLPF